MTTEYIPWKGVVPVDIPAGTELLISTYVDAVGRTNSMQGAFREKWDRTWQPPFELERAP